MQLSFANMTMELNIFNIAKQPTMQMMELLMWI